MFKGVPSRIEARRPNFGESSSFDSAEVKTKPQRVRSLSVVVIPRPCYPVASENSSLIVIARIRASRAVSCGRGAEYAYSCTKSGDTTLPHPRVTKRRFADPGTPGILQDRCVQNLTRGDGSCAAGTLRPSWCLFCSSFSSCCASARAVLGHASSPLLPSVECVLG